eukprot:GEMP01011966.1.p1 GENE.GEMP01011966.1~~GEMP01011966.1.p1  ORF type:complete len:706 (+),score=118.36 GEMP01011966.1:47-2119(+)
MDDKCEMTSAQYKQLGNESFTTKDFAAAVLHYTSAINESPDDHALYSNRCMAYSKAGDMDAALKDAYICVEKSHDHDFVKGHLHLQRCLRHFTMNSEALRIVEEGLKRWPNEKELNTAREQLLGDTDSISAAAGASNDVNRESPEPAVDGSTPNSSSSAGTPAPWMSAESKSAPKSTVSGISKSAVSSERQSEVSAKKEVDSEDCENEDSKTDPEALAAIAETEARELKARGNELYKSGKYTKACDLYSQALDVCPDNALFTTVLGNRSATYMMLCDAPKCRRDCEEALKRDSTQTKIWNRSAMTYVAEGNFIQARSVLSEGNLPTADVDSIQRHFKQAEELSTESPSQALRLLLNLEDKLFSYLTLQHLICKCHLNSGNLGRVSTMTSNMIRKNASDATAMVLHAEAIFRSSEKLPSELTFNEPLERALQFCRSALSSDPDSVDALALRKKLKLILDKVKLAKEAVHCRDFDTAKEHYAAITAADPKNKMLHARCMKECANANLRLKNYEACIKDCNQAVYDDRRLVDVYLMRARAYQELNKHTEAIKELENLFSWHREEKVQEKLQEAIFRKKKFERPDLYAELGVPSIASSMEIRKGYRQKATECHPDKAAHKGVEERKTMEERFKLITQYYEILTDLTAKELYDKGHDLESIKEQMEKKKAEEQAREQFSGMGGMPRGFPGGFHFG